MKKNLSEKIIKRLTLYHFILEDCEQSGLEYISSPRIAELLKIDNSQVRKDIKAVNNFGKCKIGYSVKSLKKSIEDALGFEKTKEAFIIGAGNIGTALIKYDDLKNYGLNILALFDIDPLKVGMTINSKEVFHLSKLPNLVERLNIDIAILTVPKETAQSCADFLVKSGIKYIWNFTPRVLKVDKNVRVWNENLIGNFLQVVAEDEVTENE
jgi:redox-sensing transcriptional repressor